MQRLYYLPEHALIDMGDFVGGTLKYLRTHPVARLTIAGGRREALAQLVAARARKVALATFAGRTEVEAR